MADPAAFAKLVPGFDFLQGLMKGAGESLPAMGQWIAPSLDPEEIDKRIRDLRTVQFWLEQNAKMIGATIQALEVQRMTLNTLQGMNVPVDALRESMKMQMPSAPAPSPTPSPSPSPTPKAAPKAAAATGVDPMAWWGALTQQFGELAANALKEMPAAATATAATPAPKPAAKKAAGKAAKKPVNRAATAPRTRR
jgi:hypothetical protein